MTSSHLPQFNNIPFSGDSALCRLPSSRAEFDASYPLVDNGLPSFFDHSVFANSSSYHPPLDFLSRTRRISGDAPDVVYPQQLVSWFPYSDRSLPFVYEDALDLYFCIWIPFMHLSNIFSGPGAVPEKSRKTHMLSLVSRFTLHLVCPSCLLFSFSY